MRRLSKLVITTGVLILLIPVGILISLYTRGTSQGFGCATKDPTPVCGNIDPSENVMEGKRIYNIHCAACHAINRDHTGPALAKADSATFFKYINKLTTKIYTSNFQKLGIDYHQSNWGEQLDSIQKRQLFEYVTQKEE